MALVPAILYKDEIKNWDAIVEYREIISRL